MANITFECPVLCGEVRVCAERILLKDDKLKAKRSSPELRSCSHAGNGKCKVTNANESKPDIKGFPYIGTVDCAYLKILGHD
jgi:hypothetical protein